MSLCISDWIGNVDDIDTVYWSYMDGTERLGIVYGVSYNGQTHQRGIPRALCLEAED
jgi:hypothetical protein